MNGGPYRAPQPADRRVINRAGAAAPSGSSSAPSTAYRQSDDASMSLDESPRVSSRAQEPPRPPVEKKSRKGLLGTLLVVIVLAGLVIAGLAMWNNTKNGVTGIDSSRYQAVFLSNGQIYFGKMTAFNDESFKISNVYYPEAQVTDDEAEQTNATSQSSIKLIPVVDGVHGPEDEMIITKSQILYYENLKADSQAAQLIERQRK